MMRKIEINADEMADVNMMITIAVTVSGNASRQELDDAFSGTVAAYENLNTHIVIGETGEKYYEDYDRPESRLYYTELPLDELVNEQEKIRFRIENGEYLRLFVDDSVAGTLRLYFLMHHAGGDGKSLCYFIESFLGCLSGKNPTASPLVLLGTDIFPEKSRLIPLYRRYVNRMNRKWEKEKRVFTFDDFQKASDLFWHTHSTETVFSSLNPEEMEKMLEECHENRISFTSLYMAELLKDTDSGQNIGLAVNIRHSGDRTMGNQVAGIQLKYRYKHSAGVMENAKKLNKLLKEALNNPRQKFFSQQFTCALEPTLLDAAVMEYAGYFHSKVSENVARWLPYMKNSYTKNDISISNMGVLDIPLDYGSFSIEDFRFVPPNTGYAKDVIGMVTVRGRLNVALHRYR